ncbi:pyruvate kinase II [Legionella beliardensis]|uniref:Pyruvate kinase n=1 Tax=Legionella beliardensis TaxID=91822 RepID=A0A378HZE1_9GAMM|nr:pyruvate kinase [Legionella beliardensis]STX27666.1 pyruvate kinase II [Legionella beliardensis]
MLHRRTKIVATLGPACSQADTLRAILAAGVDVLRVNFSHADQSVLTTITTARAIAYELNRPLAVMADLQGPKLRVGKFHSNQINLVPNQQFILDCATKELGDDTFVGVSYSALCHEVAPGDTLLLNDGLIELKVTSVEAPRIFCKVIEGGILKNNKGLNRKGGGLAARALTDKDREDIHTAVEMAVDYLTLSFVQDESDIAEARQILDKLNAPNIPIIAKIERTEALHNLAEIINASDAVMVARGDLGVEIGEAEVPAIQKKIIEQARRLDKVVITATQMMESMIYQPQPTRAEVSDVANAILDGTDAVMLSAETATGQYPVKVVEMVNKICLSAEKHAAFLYTKPEKDTGHYDRADQAIAMATMYTANHFPIEAIVALTESGASAVWMSRHQSKVPIYAISANPRTVNKLSLVNNIFPILYDFHPLSLDIIKKTVVNHLIKLKLLKVNSFVLLTRGQVIGEAGGTNCMEIIQVTESDSR